MSKSLGQFVSEYGIETLRIKSPLERARSLTYEGDVLFYKGQFEAAAEFYSQALQLEPQSITIRANLAGALLSMGSAAESIEHYMRVLATTPVDIEALCNLGAARVHEGDFTGAIDCFQRALAYSPDNPEALLHLANVHLLRGDFENGWRYYESRLAMKPWVQRPFREPLWQGQAIRGDRILIYSEQGLGDTLQFLRYIPMVARRGAKVVLEVQSELKCIVGAMPDVTEMISPGEGYAPVSWQCSLLSLPEIFGTRFESIPKPVPYISAQTLPTVQWKHHLQSFRGFKVGLVWAGNPKNRRDRYRSLPLSKFLVLNRIEGVNLLSLQKGVASKQIQDNRGEMEVHDIESHCKSLADTAAVIACLDLVITVDTMIAHLAGSMGKAVWILLCFSPDFRWLLQRPTSPWYPTARLFRQPTPGDWDKVILEVARALREQVAGSAGSLGSAASV